MQAALRTLRTAAIAAGLLLMAWSLWVVVLGPAILNLMQPR